MKKIYKVTWYAANVLLPLSETARILRTMKYSGSKLAEQARRLKQEKQTASNEILSFDEALRISGMSHETLIRRYLSTKRIWLMLFGVAVIFIVLLPFATLMVEGPVSGTLIVRVMSMAFMLVGFAGLMFARSLNSQYHLWQLQARYLGTFAEWKAAGHWLRDIFSWQLR
jgi:FlaA1/EpsC-like NDP-sugar epimerase